MKNWLKDAITAENSPKRTYNADGRAENPAILRVITKKRQNRPRFFVQKGENRKNTEKVLQISRKVVKYRCGRGWSREGEAVMKRTGKDCLTGKVVTVFAEEKDIHGKTIWRTSEGKAYELSGSRHLGRQTWVMSPNPLNDK